MNEIERPPKRVRQKDLKIFVEIASSFDINTYFGVQGVKIPYRPSLVLAVDCEDNLYIEDFHDWQGDDAQYKVIQTSQDGYTFAKVEGVKMYWRNNESPCYVVERGDEVRIINEAVIHNMDRKEILDAIFKEKVAIEF